MWKVCHVFGPDPVLQVAILIHNGKVNVLDERVGSGSADTGRLLAIVLPLQKPARANDTQQQEYEQTELLEVHR